MDFHEAANIFPLDEENIGDLAKDIRQHGLQVPIERLDGKIIDGRRRAMACQRAGVIPKYRDITTDDPIGYVLSLNLHRRQLTASQRSMVGRRAQLLYDKFKKEAKERQKKHGSTAPGKKKTLPEDLPEVKGDTRDFVGETVGVSGKMIDYAGKVMENGVPELIKAVDEGRMAVGTAAILCTEPEEKQREEIEFNSDGRRKTRRYKAGENATRPDEPEDERPEGERRGVGVIRANEAINSLTRIPKNDPLRQRGLQLVKDWIRHNQ